jgi:hypothetical protein
MVDVSDGDTSADSEDGSHGIVDGEPDDFAG